MMEKVLEHLEQWHSDLLKTTEFGSLEERASHIGLLNAVELSLKQLRLCNAYGIFPSARVHVLPEVVRPDYQPEYRLIDDGESNDRDHWKEVLFPNKRTVRLTGGDIVIQK
jgi:hypothetical protein